MMGEAGISGLWDRRTPEAPPGYQGRHAGREDVSTGETLPGLCFECTEETLGIRLIAESRESPVGSRMES